MRFVVHGYTETGAEREIIVDAATEDDAATIVRGDGVFPDQIRPAPIDPVPHPESRAEDSPDTSPPPAGRILFAIIVLVFGGYVALQILSEINPFKRDPNYSPTPFTEYKTNRELLQEYHDQGRFLGYPLSEADQWAEDMDALLEARKSEYYAPN